MAFDYLLYSMYSSLPWYLELNGRHSVRVAHDLLEIVPTAQIRGSNSLPMGRRGKPPSCNSILVRHDGLPFLPRGHRMRFWCRYPPFSLLFLSPPPSRSAHRDLSGGRRRCKCVRGCPGLRIESYYVGDCAVEIVIYFGGGADLSYGCCGVVFLTGRTGRGQVFEAGGAGGCSCAGDEATTGISASGVGC